MKKEHPDKKVNELTKILAEQFKNIDPEQKKIMKLIIIKKWNIGEKKWRHTKKNMGTNWK